MSKPITQRVMERTCLTLAVLSALSGAFVNCDEQPLPEQDLTKQTQQLDSALHPDTDELTAQEAELGNGSDSLEQEHQPDKVDSVLHPDTDELTAQETGLGDGSDSLELEHHRLAVTEGDLTQGCYCQNQFGEVNQILINAKQLPAKPKEPSEHQYIVSGDSLNLIFSIVHILRGAKDLVIDVKEELRLLIGLAALPWKKVEDIESFRTLTSAESELSQVISRLEYFAVKLRFEERDMQNAVVAIEEGVRHHINARNVFENRSEGLTAENVRLVKELQQEQEKYQTIVNKHRQLEKELLEITNSTEKYKNYIFRECKKSKTELEGRVFDLEFDLEDSFHRKRVLQVNLESELEKSHHRQQELELEAKNVSRHLNQLENFWAREMSYLKELKDSVEGHGTLPDKEPEDILSPTKTAKTHRKISENELSKAKLHVAEVMELVANLTEEKLALQNDKAAKWTDQQDNIDQRKVCELRTKDLTDENAHLADQLRLEREKVTEYLNREVAQLCV